MGDPPFHLSADDSILENEEISWVVRRILLNRSGDPSGTPAEHIHQWLIAVMQYDLPDATNWMKIDDIVQKAFQDGILTEECTWQTVVLIPKGEGDFWRIELVGVLWKTIASLINGWIMV